MSDDIVARLRDWASCICTVNTSVTPGSKARMAREAADEIERLRKERDEARRWFCFEARRASDGKNSETRAREIAEMFFWDCFKEVNNG